MPTDLEEEAGKVQSPFITDGMTRSSAQLSWHFMKLLHDTERGTLVIVHRGLHDLIGPYLITPMIGEPVTGWWGRRQRYGMSNPSAEYYGGLMAVHGERIRRVVVVEVVISYIIRALSTPAKQRAAAAAELRALKRDARGRP